MSCWFSHPTGNANVRFALAGLRRAGLLDAYWTTIGVSGEAAWLRLLPAGTRARLERRAYDLPARMIRTCPLPEVRRLLATGGDAGARNLAVAEVYRSLDRRVATALDRAGSRRVPEVVYGYEDGAATTFASARSWGIARVYDLPIGYWREAREILAKERDRSPQWASTLGGLNEPAWKLERKEQEVAQASVILVASSFTRDSLRSYPGPLPPVHVIPYGVPTPASRPPAPRAEGAPLRLLFVGGLSQRKGLSDLFEAVERAGRAVELTVVGRRPEGCRVLDEALARHRWIPSLPHADLLALMRRHDVLVFPSLFEGFGLVITEALAQGLAVVTTSRTAGPDLIAPGREGLLVPPADPEALEAALADLAGDRVRLAAMQEAALDRARTLSWERYGDGVAAVVREAAGPAGRRVGGGGS